jgi:septation ring formation regulator EzrA
MTMQVLNRESVAEKFAMENLSELHKVRESIRIYEKKYGTTLEEFEQQLEEQDEQFEHFDDYIDWKAAVKWRSVLEERLEELQHGDFKVT